MAVLAVGHRLEVVGGEAVIVSLAVDFVVLLLDYLKEYIIC
jgi:hypothetical protein